MSIWPDQENTDELLQDVRDGRQAALDRLFERHRVALRRMIDVRMDRRLMRRVDASDIVQDVLIEASRRLNDYLAQPTMPFHLWLRQIARDRIVDTHRRHRVAARRSLDREQPLAGTGASQRSTPDLADELCDDQLTPAAAAEWQELAERFHAACDQLDEQDQEIILMRHFEQMTNSESAAALGVSAQAASMRYLRAMRRLRTLLPAE
jgi:RNA polymerase sigma-70 factor (ECF subfamily)